MEILLTIMDLETLIEKIEALKAKKDAIDMSDDEWEAHLAETYVEPTVIFTFITEEKMTTQKEYKKWASKYKKSLRCESFFSTIWRVLKKLVKKGDFDTADEMPVDYDFETDTVRFRGDEE
jgi:hypothetical protein